MNPSVILAELSTSSAPAALFKLLEKNLYSVLDTLPTAQKSLVLKALAEVRRESENSREIRDKIGYDEHKTSLDEGVKALLKDVKRNWKHGYDDQFEMMSTITDEILAWLPILWSVAVEDGQELDLICKCLVLCSETIDKVVNSHSRAEFTDVEHSLVIKDSKNTTVYEEQYASISHSLSWLWREFLVAAEAQGALTTTTKSDVDRLNLKKEVYGLIRLAGEDEHCTGYSFWDAHWTPAMKDASSRLLVGQHAARVASFLEAPSFKLYNELMLKSPELKTTLLDATRSCIFPSDPDSDPTISYNAAAEIFNAASQTDDLVRLFTALPRWSSKPAIPQAKQIIAKHLSTQSVPEHRKMALDIAKQGLSCAIQNTIEEVERAFPGFEDACIWLEEEIDEGRLTRKAPEKGKNYYKLTPAQQKLIDQRDNTLEEFVTIAGKRPYGECYGYDGSWDDSMDDLDPEDSDYEEEKNARCPNLDAAICSWAALLQDLPDKEATKDIWDTVHRDIAAEFLDVDGVAEQLASRCDWEWSHDGRKQYIANGLRAIDKLFS